MPVRQSTIYDAQVIWAGCQSDRGTNPKMIAIMKLVVVVAQDFKYIVATVPTPHYFFPVEVAAAAVFPLDTLQP